MNQPVRSPRISVGLECAAVLALVGDSTLGGLAGGGGGLSRCSLRERGGDNVDVTSLPPIVAGGDMDTEGHREPVGDLSRGHRARSLSNCDSLLIKWLSVLLMLRRHYDQACPPHPTTRKDPGKEIPAETNPHRRRVSLCEPLRTNMAHDTRGVAFHLRSLLKEVFYTPNRASQTL